MSSALIEKIRKLRALATSDNVNEAAAAAAAAERLIAEHDLSEASFALPEDDATVTYETIFTWGKRITRWQEILLACLRQAYSCKAYLDQTGGNGIRYVAYGRPQDLETLSYQYAYLSSEILRLAGRECKGKGKAYSNAFKIGAADAIGKAILETNRQSRSQASSQALTVVDQRLARATEAMYRDHPNLRKRTTNASTVDGAGLAAGRAAAANVNQRTQIGANGTRLLGS